MNHLFLDIGRCDNMLFYLGTVTTIRDEGSENHLHIVLGAMQVALREMRFSILHDIYADLVVTGMKCYGSYRIYVNSLSSLCR